MSNVPATTSTTKIYVRLIRAIFILQFRTGLVTTMGLVFPSDDRSNFLADSLWSSSLCQIGDLVMS